MPTAKKTAKAASAPAVQPTAVAAAPAQAPVEAAHTPKVHDTAGHLVGEANPEPLDQPQDREGMDEGTPDDLAAFAATAVDTTMQGPFTGSKQVLARPMNRREYNAYRGWELPADEDGDDAGMLVEYIDGGKANDPRHAGYISWSPLDVFQRAYSLNAPGAAESDAEFVLELFKVNKAKFFDANGVLDRALLRADLDAYRNVYANRVLVG